MADDHNALPGADQICTWVALHHGYLLHQIHVEWVLAAIADLLAAKEPEQ